MGCNFCSALEHQHARRFACVLRSAWRHRGHLGLWLSVRVLLRYQTSHPRLCTLVVFYLTLGWRFWAALLVNALLWYELVRAAIEVRIVLT